MLNKAELLNAMRLKTELVMLDAGEVLVSEIGAADYIKLWSENLADQKLDMSTFTPALVAYSVVDENGKRMFTDEEIAVLAKSANAPFTKLAQAARRVNGLTGSEVKNSDPSQAGSSASASA